MCYVFTKKQFSNKERAHILDTPIPVWMHLFHLQLICNKTDTDRCTAIQLQTAQGRMFITQTHLWYNLFAWVNSVMFCDQFDAVVYGGNLPDVSPEPMILGAVYS